MFTYRKLSKQKYELMYELGIFDKKQINEIRTGFLHGLKIKQIELYANSEFTWQQMEEIRKGFENGLTMEQVKLYAKSEFDYKQMFEIRKGFENGLSIEQIKLFSNPKNPWFSMHITKSNLLKQRRLKNIW